MKPPPPPLYTHTLTVQGFIQDFRLDVDQKRRQKLNFNGEINNEGGGGSGGSGGILWPSEITSGAI